MVELRWRQRAGPGMLALGLIGLLTTAPAAALDSSWSPAECAATPRVTRGGAVDSSGEAWYRIDQRLDERGSLIGRRLTINANGLPSPRALDLASESFAAGPFDGLVLTGSDDGRQSSLRLVDAAGACAWTIATERAVIRRATIDPAGAAIYEFRVDRRTRADLGVWRRPFDAANSATRVLPPIAADARFGRTFTTELWWSLDGDRLVVQSCGETACRTRIFATGTGDVTLVDAEGLGEAIGLAGDQLISYEPCGGLPCPIVAVDVDRGTRTVVSDSAGLANLVTTTDGPRLVHEEGGSTGRLRIVDPAGVEHGWLDPEPGRRLVPGAARADAAVRVAPGWVAFAPGARPAPGAAAVLRLVTKEIGR